jgi:hypothetical protein
LQSVNPPLACLLTSERALQANFCIFTPSSSTTKERILQCTDNVTHPGGRYFAQLGDDCSFCTYGGPGAAPPKRGVHPPVEQAIWCGFKGPCPVVAALATNTTNPPTLEATTSNTFPTDCTLKQWQKLGMDLDSLVADPKISHPGAGGGWQLDADSPALKLGFKQLDLSTVGPRSSRGRTPSK